MRVCVWNNCVVAPVERVCFRYRVRQRPDIPWDRGRKSLCHRLASADRYRPPVRPVTCRLRPERERYKPATRQSRRIRKPPTCRRGRSVHSPYWSGLAEREPLSYRREKPEPDSSHRYPPARSPVIADRQERRNWEAGRSCLLDRPRYRDRPRSRSSSSDEVPREHPPIDTRCSCRPGTTPP